MASVLVAFVTALVLTGLTAHTFRKKGIRPAVREDTPERHRAEKSGTPILGGIAILLATLLGVALHPSAGVKEMFLFLCALPFALLGATDDFTKALQKRKVVGLKARYKLLLQFLFGFSASLFIAHQFGDRALKLALPWDGWFHFPFWSKVALDTFIFVGAANAVNLTDGLDGLAGGLVAICCVPLLVLSFEGSPRGLLLALLGACLGFLWFNVHPAAIFMGDTGSLFLGALLAAFSSATGLELLFAIAGLVFVAEALSVILQVIYFKTTGGRRIFKMTPLHHHFELSGWPEPRIVSRFWLAGLAVSGLAIFAGGR